MKLPIHPALSCVLVILLAVAPVAATGTDMAEPGVVVIVAAIPESAQTDPHFPFQLGDIINLTGTNTGSATTYLFLIGPNLKANGSQIQSDYPPSAPVVEGDAASFATAAVGEDGRWSYAWDTGKTTLATGVYTIFAVSRPHDKAHLASSPYGTTSLILGSRNEPVYSRQDTLTLEELVIVNPGGPVISGTPVTVTSSVNVILTGKETFPSDYDMVFSTTLDNPQWTSVLVLEGVRNQRPASTGSVLDISGFELSYLPGTVSEEQILVTLQGTAPAVREGITKKVIQISIVDNNGNIVPDSTVTREITILPLPEMTPYDTTTTAPGIGL